MVARMGRECPSCGGAMHWVSLAGWTKGGRVRALDSALVAMRELLVGGRTDIAAAKLWHLWACINGYGQLCRHLATLGLVWAFRFGLGERGRQLCIVREGLWRRRVCVEPGRWLELHVVGGRRSMRLVEVGRRLGHIVIRVVQNHVAEAIFETASSAMPIHGWCRC